MMEFKIEQEFIPLIGLLKASNLVSTGGEAQIAVVSGQVRCNGQVELRKRFKVRPGHIVEYKGCKIKVG